MFEQKNISIMKLCCHLSDGCTAFLMIIGIIGSTGLGVAGPLIALFFGQTISDFNYLNKGDDDTNTLNDTVDDMVKKYLYIGVGVFVTGFLANFIWSYVGLLQFQNLKEKYFSVILNQEQGWFDEINTFQFVTNVQTQLEQIELGLGDKFGLFIQMRMQIIAGLVIAFYSSWKVTLMMITVIPFIFITYCLFSIRKEELQERSKYAGRIAEEVVYNIKTIASFANFNFEKERFGEYVDKVHVYKLENANTLGRRIGGTVLFLNFSIVIAILYSRRLIANDIDNNKSLNDRLKVCDILTVILSVIMIIIPISSIAPNTQIIKNATAASSDYFTLYERQPKIDNYGKFRPSIDSFKGKIEFKNVSFIYPSDVKQRRILNNLDLVFESGQKVAIVGESKCGKSAIINLIERLYEPCNGQILIDGTDIKEYDLDYLRTFIGYVQQEPFLFNQSIRNNLIFGRYDIVRELGDPEKLIDEACKEAYAKEFINKKKDKYDYYAGFKGGRLSIAQKQKIAIARAILCKPKILILDEVTSALDHKSEKEVQQAIDKINEKDITTIIIANRPSTIKNADVIYLIKEGRVYAKGTHEELLKNEYSYYTSLEESKSSREKREREENSPSNPKSPLPLRNKLSEPIQTETSRNYEAFDELMRIIKAQKKEKSDRKGLFSLLSGHKCDAFLGDIGALGTGAMTVVRGFVLSKSIFALSGITSKDVKDDGLFWAMMFLVVTIADCVFTSLKIRKFQTIGSAIAKEMKKKVFDKYLKLHIGYFDIYKNTPEALSARISIYTNQLSSIISTVYGEIFSVFGTVVTGLIFGFFYSWRLTLINLCFLLFMVIAQLIINKARKGRDRRQKLRMEARSFLSECINNTKTIYSFNFQKPAIEMFSEFLEKSTETNCGYSFLGGFFAGLGNFAIYASNATIFHYAFIFFTDKKITFESMFIAIICAMMLTQGVFQSLTGTADYSKITKSLNVFYKTLETCSSIDSSEEVNKTKNSAKRINGRIEFKNVTFAYPTEPNQKILRNINFTIEAGQSTAFVGCSGCGKSTIIQLLERYYDPDEGEILIDEVNVKDYNLLELRRKIGLVQQEPVLFERSVYDNILYGNLDATREEVFEAAKKAGIEEYFNNKGIEALSQEKKQRLAIARTFLKNPTILLLDEVTSGLDKENEVILQRNIEILQKGRTSVIVTNKPDTIEKSDVIFVLEEGKIVEKGTHEELMALGREYAKLHALEKRV